MLYCNSLKTSDTVTLENSLALYWVNAEMFLLWQIAEFTSQSGNDFQEDWPNTEIMSVSSTRGNYFPLDWVYADTVSSYTESTGKLFLYKCTFNKQTETETAANNKQTHPLPLLHVHRYVFLWVKREEVIEMLHRNHRDDGSQGPPQRRVWGVRGG